MSVLRAMHHSRDHDLGCVEFVDMSLPTTAVPLEFCVIVGFRV